MSRTISSDEPIHNVTDAETVLRQLEEHRVVMETREEVFTRVLERGEKMIEDGLFASEEVRFNNAGTFRRFYDKPVANDTSLICILDHSS